ncbi:uncharacterized protein BJ171DRAFT_507682 [Polychytrium aggregatum]|uniref:uncharacterized protein n=1 Tax=Polychytrium aggregatum TaxID=110093 RepID=UPI0022FDC4E8|nr:uncharacterized protein BJ171DRAFT_507682 [Polychytrium aggregatum]KAI9204121.1 hypothetical protein BJ171DRAFT_507682 [Polychytrium aggregatum]
MKLSSWLLVAFYALVCSPQTDAAVIAHTPDYWIVGTNTSIIVENVIGSLVDMFLFEVTMQGASNNIVLNCTSLTNTKPLITLNAPCNQTSTSCNYTVSCFPLPPTAGTANLTIIHNPCQVIGNSGIGCVGGGSMFAPMTVTILDPINGLTSVPTSWSSATPGPIAPTPSPGADDPLTQPGSSSNMTLIIAIVGSIGAAVVFFALFGLWWFRYRVPNPQARNPFTTQRGIRGSGYRVQVDQPGGSAAAAGDLPHNKIAMNDLAKSSPIRSVPDSSAYHIADYPLSTTAAGPGAAAGAARPAAYPPQSKTYPPQSTTYPPQSTAYPPASNAPAGAFERQPPQPQPLQMGRIAKDSAFGSNYDPAALASSHSMSYAFTSGPVPTQSAPTQSPSGNPASVRYIPPPVAAETPAGPAGYGPSPVHPGHAQQPLGPRSEKAALTIYRPDGSAGSSTSRMADSPAGAPQPFAVYSHQMSPNTSQPNFVQSQPNPVDDLPAYRPPSYALYPSPK